MGSVFQWITIDVFQWFAIVACVLVTWAVSVAMHAHRHLILKIGSSALAARSPWTIAVHVTRQSSDACEWPVWYILHCLFSPVPCQSKTKCTCDTVANGTASIVRTPSRTENKSQANKAVNRSAQLRFLANQRPSFAPGYLGRSSDATCKRKSMRLGSRCTLRDICATTAKTCRNSPIRSRDSTQ